jgi:Uma2 family endonuclease
MVKVLERPTTSADKPDTTTTEERYRQACDLFSDSRVEVVDGRIVVNEVPTGDHNTIVSLLLMQLFGVVKDQGWHLWTNIKLFPGPQVDRYIPDLTVVPQEQRMWGDDEVFGDCTLLVVEVVSMSSVHDDRVVKPRGCAAAGVPLYLVIDTFEDEVSLLSGPGQAGYAKKITVPLGKPLDLPEPWNLTIDTGTLTP